MPRYWVIAPCDSKKVELFETAWAYDLRHGTIAVGWTELGECEIFEQGAAIREV